MAFYFPGINRAPAGDINDPNRSQDFENLIGNYFITEFQLTRLKARIADFIKTNPNKSTFMFRSNEEKPKWYTVHVQIEEMNTKEEPDAEPTQQVEEPYTTNEVAVLDDDDDPVPGLP